LGGGCAARRLRAILGSILQCMLYSSSVRAQLAQEIVSVANNSGALKSLSKVLDHGCGAPIVDGTLEIVNCGHVQPLLVEENKSCCPPPKQGNLAL